MSAKRSVAAAIIKNNQGEILICQRGAGGSCAFLYEFPGGKTEEGESLVNCLKRECKEELAIDLDVGPKVYVTEHVYTDIHVELHFFSCTVKNGMEPQALEHESVRWIRIEEIHDFEFCPADAELIEKLHEGLINV